MVKPEKLNIKWLEKALLEFDDALDFLAEKNQSSAENLAKIVTDAVNALEDQPHLGRPGRVKGTRELVINGYPYLIPFRVINNEVQILRVFHTKRKPPLKW